MANQILAGAVVSAGAVIAGVDANNPPVTGSAPAPSLGDPFPHAGDMKSTDAPYPLYAHLENANDWLTYGVTANETYGTSGGRPRMTDEAAGAIHFIRYDVTNEMLYGFMSYADSSGPESVLNDLGWGGMGDFWSFWTNFGNNTHAAPIGSYFPIGIRRPMTEAEFDALDLYWDADGGQSGQGSWRINPDVEIPTMPTPATSVDDASFNAEASDGLAVVHNSRFDVFASWISYGTVGFHGNTGGRDRIVADGTDTGAVHYLRYDPIGKRIWALVSWHPQGGGIGPTLVENGFGDLTTDFSSEPFFNGYMYNNFTHTAPIGSYFPGIVGSRLTYEPEDLAGLGITWNGTSWQAPQASAPAPFGYEGTTQTLTLDGVTKDVHVSNDGWILYDSFSSDNELTQSDAPAWNGNNILMPDMSSYGWDAQYAQEYHDGTNVAGAGNNYNRPDGSIMFWGSSASNGGITMTSWNGPSNATQIAVDWGYVDGFNGGHINVNNGPNITDQPAMESFDPTASDLMQLVEFGVSIVYIKSIWFKV